MDTNDPLGVRARVALGETTRYCTATNRNGEPCGRSPIKGGTVCHFHGGAAPQARRAAQLRLLSLIEPSFAVVADFLTPREPCKACGRSDKDRDPAVLRAAQIVLDRTGFHPSISVQTSRAESRPQWVSWLTDEQLVQVSEWIAEAKRRMTAGAPPPLALPSATTRLLSGSTDNDALVLDEDAMTTRDGGSANQCPRAERRIT
jgi:hypothetical protein